MAISANYYENVIRCYRCYYKYYLILLTTFVNRSKC